MTYINKSPHAPASVDRAYKLALRDDEYTKHNFFMPPPHNISHYLEHILQVHAKNYCLLRKDRRTNSGEK